MSKDGRRAARPRGIAVILLGPPGCGKGTQARELSRTFGFTHLSTGDMLRSTAAKDSELGHVVRTTMNAGELVPDELICRIVADRITPADLEGGLVLDGFPRTLEQARFLSMLLGDQKAIALNMQVSRGLLVKRIMGRLTCPACGEIYNVFFKPPRSTDHCDRDGSRLERRTDDSETTIRQRLISHEKDTQPLIEHFRKMNILHDVEADVDSCVLSRQLRERLYAAMNCEFSGTEKA
jgi:adenylate kinase